MGGFITSQPSGSSYGAATGPKEVVTFVPPRTEVGSSFGVTNKHMDPTFLANAGTGSPVLNSGFSPSVVGSTINGPRFSCQPNCIWNCV